MPRATNAPASRERRRRVLRKAKGYRGRRSKLFRYAKDATMKGQYWAYRDRKTRKRNFRMLWIQRLNAAVRANGMTYSRFAERFNVHASARTIMRRRPGPDRVGPRRGRPRNRAGEIPWTQRQRFRMERQNEIAAERGKTGRWQIVE